MTVVFATRNRADTLAPVLDCFTQLRSPEGGWELLVVDNGSTDTTATLLAGYHDRLPLTVLFEPTTGKNRALNLALPAFEGSLVVLTDDDVLPAADWLCQMQQAADAHPEAALFGGTVLPHWSEPRPAWLTEAAVPFSVLYAQQKRAAGACSYDAIFGPNMAVRRSVFEAGFRFSEAVGPDESRHLYAMGGETEFLRRVQAAGYKSWFVPQALVGHIVRPPQLTEAWILARGYRYGRGEGRHYAGAASASRSGLPAGLRLRGLAYGIAAQLCRLLPMSATRLRMRYKASMLNGTIAALRQEWIGQPEPSALPSAAGRRQEVIATHAGD
ncbi:glycosyltransferase [Lichenicoccus sp.]|uniref:glycosyltransferase n=1 Tax=Lichenicoccus sp. TaxID=2781899 RepID=UPI003D11E964